MHTEMSLENLKGRDRIRHRWEDNIKAYLHEVGCRLNSAASGQAPVGLFWTQ